MCAVLRRAVECVLTGGCWVGRVSGRAGREGRDSPSANFPLFAKPAEQRFLANAEICFLAYLVQQRFLTNAKKVFCAYQFG